MMELLSNLKRNPIKIPMNSSFSNIKISKNAADFILGCLQSEESKRFTWK